MNDIDSRSSRKLSYTSKLEPGSISYSREPIHNCINSGKGVVVRGPTRSISNQAFGFLSERLLRFFQRVRIE